MVGGDRAVFDQVKDVLADMAASVVYVGEIGAGNIAKLANQVVVALNIAAVSEALVLAKKAGVAPQAVVEAIRRRTGRQRRARGQGTDDAGPRLQARDSGSICIIKDLLNALETSHGVGAALPLTAAVLEMMTALKAAGTRPRGPQRAGPVLRGTSPRPRSSCVRMMIGEEPT